MAVAAIPKNLVALARPIQAMPRGAEKLTPIQVSATPPPHLWESAMTRSSTRTPRSYSSHRRRSVRLTPTLRKRGSSVKVTKYTSLASVP